MGLRIPCVRNYETVTSTSVSAQLECVHRSVTEEPDRPAPQGAEPQNGRVASSAVEGSSTCPTRRGSRVVCARFPVRGDRPSLYLRARSRLVGRPFPGLFLLLRPSGREGQRERERRGGLKRGRGREEKRLQIVGMDKALRAGLFPERGVRHTSVLIESPLARRRRRRRPDMKR